MENRDEYKCNLLEYYIEKFAKMPKLLKEKFERAKSCCFRGCKFCKTIYSNFSIDNETFDSVQIDNMPDFSKPEYDRFTNEEKEYVKNYPLNRLCHNSI